MAYATLALIQPLDPATGNRVSIYVSSINDAATGRLVNGLNGNVWVPAITQAPTISITVWNGDFQNSVSLGSASLPINMQAVKDVFPSADTYYWETAPVTIYAEQPGTAWPWTQRFKGLVTGYGRKAQVLTLTAQVDTKALEANVLTQAYAGTGGIEGDSNLKNKLKPLIFGWASNVEPVLVDTVNNVYQFCAYGAIEAVTTLYERGSDFGASVGDFANYTALVAASIAPGKWGTCLASGLIRLGAPAYGVITGDVKGYKVSTTTPRRTGAIINAAAAIAGVSSTFINTSSLTSLDTAAAYNVNIVLTEQTTLLELAQRMALPCLWQCGVNLDGTLFVSQITLAGSPVLSLDGAGKTFPQVVASDELDVTVPYYKTVLGANRSWRVHSADEIAFASKLVEVGLYSGSTTYREGNIVSLSNGARYLYINATASAGNTPPNATYWSLMSGSPVVDTAAAITGQTAWATYSSFTPQQVAQVSPNMIPNPTGILGTQGWTLYLGAITTAKGQNGEGWFFWANSGGSATPQMAYRDVPAAAGNTYTLSADLAAAGITVTSGSAQVRCYIEWLTNVGAHIAYSAIASVNAGTNWTHATSGPIVAPATTAFARIWMDTWGSGTYTVTSVGWAKLKLQAGSVDTVFSDDATYGAKYDDGTAMQSLQPAQAGADVTGSHTAAAITGQTGWATYATLTPAQLGALQPNMLYNPTAVLGLDNWIKAGAATAGYSQGSSEGYYFYCASGSNTTDLSYYQDVPVVAGNAYTISGDLYALGITVTSGSPLLRIYIQWLDSGGAHISYSTAAQLAAGQNWTHVVASGQVAPSGAVAARVRVDCVSGVFTITNVAWKRLKLQVGTVDSIFTDDASYSGVGAEKVSYPTIQTGQLNTSVSASQSGSLHLPIPLNSPNGGTGTVVAAPVITSNNAADAIFVDASVVITAGSVRAEVKIERSYDNSSWTSVKSWLISSGSPGTTGVGTWVMTTFEDTSHTTGTIYYRVQAYQNAAQSLGDGTAGTNWTLTTGTIKVRKYFSK